MKLIKLLTIVVLVSSIFISCTKEDVIQNQTKNSAESELDLSNLNFDFNLSFDGRDIKIPIEEGYDNFVKELSEYAFSEEVANQDKVSLFQVEWTEEFIWVNRTESSSMKTNATLEPCKPQSKTVHSSGDFEDVMEGIFSQERNVEVSIEYGNLGATITWAFQDC